MYQLRISLESFWCGDFIYRMVFPQSISSAKSLDARLGGDAGTG
jgi:hypothetical protein